MSDLKFSRTLQAMTHIPFPKFLDTPEERGHWAEQQVQFAVAEADGWKWVVLPTYTFGAQRPERGWRFRGDPYRDAMPSYVRDLNAIHAAVLRAGPKIIKAMRFELYELCDQMTAHEADALTRCVAYLKARDLWPPKPTC